MIRRLIIIAQCLAVGLIVSACQNAPTVATAPSAIKTPVAAQVVSNFRIPDTAIQYQRLMIRSSLAEFGHDDYVALLAAQTYAESNWRNDLVSRVGAIGPSQFMPTTAQDRIDRRGRGIPCAVIKDFEDYACALPSQTRYMADLRRSVKDAVNDCERIAMASAKYNGGGIKADRRLAQANGHDYGRWFGHTELFNGRNRSNGNFKENRDYPRKVILNYQFKFLAAGYRGKAQCSEHV